MKRNWIGCKLPTKGSLEARLPVHHGEGFERNRQDMKPGLTLVPGEVEVSGGFDVRTFSVIKQRNELLVAEF
jgi:hypothetical protein